MANGECASDSETGRVENRSRNRKRLRVNEACGACRDRKTRCDGQKPVCRACECRGIEAHCKYMRKGNGRHPRRSQAPQATLKSNLPAGNRSEAADHTPGRRSGRRNDDRADSCQPWSSRQSDGLATFAGQHDESIYGPSSTVSFLRHVVDDESSQVNPDGQTEPEAPRQGPVRVPERIRERHDGVAVLPRRRSADDFLSCYWDFIHPMFPVLHQSTFMREYERFWIAESTGHVYATPEAEAENTIFLSTLNLVFALGCKFSSLIPAAQRVSAADEFYQTSRQLFVFDVLDSASLTMVQMLILTGVYLQSTQHATRCWNSIGLAIRVAQSLGLHLDPSTRKITSQLECETRRRIWYTCVNLDRLLAMTFGRPPMIRDANAVSIPALIDDEYLTDEGGVQPTDVPSNLGLFVSSCSLLELLEEVLSFLSKNESAPALQSQGEAVHQRARLLTQVLELNRRLDDFSATVPAYLRPTEHGSPGTKLGNRVQLQQQVLYCRFLLTRMLLLRPLLFLTTTRRAPKSPPETLDEAGQAILDQEMLKKCCELCVQTAYRLVGTIHANLGTLYRSSGWHAVYFVFSSAIVLLASLKCDVLDIRMSDAAFEASWNHCLYIIRHYNDQVLFAPHAIHTLVTVRQQILKSSNLHDADPRVVGETNYMPATDASDATHQQAQRWDGNTQPDDLFSFNVDLDEYLGPHLTNLDWLELFQTQP